MRLTFTVPVGDHNYFYTLLPFGGIQTICHDGVIFLRLIKIHDHKYELTAFVYNTRKYIYPRYYSTKSKLHGAIQKFLQEEL